MRLTYQQVELQLEQTIGAAQAYSVARRGENRFSMANKEREYHDHLATMLAMIRELTE
jgi:TorA maturation chaperone TorD